MCDNRRLPSEAFAEKVSATISEFLEADDADARDLEKFIVIDKAEERMIIAQRHEIVVLSDNGATVTEKLALVTIPEEHFQGLIEMMSRYLQEKES